MPANATLSSRGTVLLSALGAAILFCASPAEAAIVNVTVVGIVASGTDTSGDFGTVGANLAGDAYTAVFKFDTTAAPSIVSAVQSSSQGGSYNGTVSPSLGASITILGNTFNIGGSYSGEILELNTGSYGHSYVDERDANVELYANLFGYPGTSPTSDTIPFSITAAAQQYAYGQFLDNSGTQLGLSPVTYALTLADTTPTSTTAVPEPASMALLGLAAAAAGAFRRKRA